MPEGDSLRRAEALLAPILEDQIVRSVWFRMLRGYRPRAGQRIERVDAIGKHLLIEFDRNLTLDTHLGMTGSWRAIGAEVAIPTNPRLRVVISTDLGHALCFAAPTIQTFIRDGSGSPVDHLGPDLSDDATDIDEVMRRSRLSPPERLVADLLLDQSVAAGIGNVFKSETLFIAGIHPFAPIGTLSDDELRRVWLIGHRQLLANRARPFRVTTSDNETGRTYVYGRFHLGCRRCENAIELSPAGAKTPRSTYWCPTCQPLAAEVSTEGSTA